MIIIKPSQKGIASLALLTIIVFGIFVMWEVNNYIQQFNSPDTSGTEAGTTGPDGPVGPPICLTGNVADCNDSNDEFLLAP